MNASAPATPIETPMSGQSWGLPRRAARKPSKPVTMGLIAHSRPHECPKGADRALLVRSVRPSPVRRVRISRASSTSRSRSALPRTRARAASPATGVSSRSGATPPLTSCHPSEPARRSRPAAYGEREKPGRGACRPAHPPCGDVVPHIVDQLVFVVVLPEGDTRAVRVHGSRVLRKVRTLLSRTKSAIRNMFSVSRDIAAW